MGIKDIIEEVLTSEVEMGIISPEEYSKKQAWLSFARYVISE